MEREADLLTVQRKREGLRLLRSEGEQVTLEAPHQAMGAKGRSPLGGLKGGVGTVAGEGSFRIA